VHTNANTPLPNPGQEAHQSDLQILLSDLNDMHRSTFKMEENMEFERGLSVLHILEIC
jgi:hypothetical protein